MIQPFIGIEFHTFSIVGRCRRTGNLGVAITTSDISVGSRCPYVVPNVGAVSTQASTDPRHGPAALRLLESGKSPDEAIQQLADSDPYIERRQLGVVDNQGRSAARTGSANAVDFRVMGVLMRSTTGLGPFIQESTELELAATINVAVGATETVGIENPNAQYLLLKVTSAAAFTVDFSIRLED